MKASHTKPGLTAATAGLYGLYARISEDRSGEAMGVTDQLADARNLVRQRGGTIVDEYTDNDLSALKGGPRPAYERLMADVDAGRITHIVVWHMSRLWRNRRERAEGIERLKAARVSVIAVKGPELDMATAYGRGVAGLIGEFDTLESEVKSERVARAAQRRAEQGLNHGGRRCFGYTRDGLSIEPAEAVEVAKMCKQFLAGVPLGAIVRDLNERGVRTVRGNEWAPGTVRDLLGRPRIAGLAVHRGTVVSNGKWPAIITEEQHHAIVALLADPSRRTSTGNKASYLLSGIARCGRKDCGASISSGGLKPWTQGKPGVRFVYRCRKCWMTRRRDWVDTYVEERIFERLAKDDAQDLLVDHDLPDVEALQDEAHALRIRLNQAAASFARGKIDEQQLEIATAEMKARLREIAEAQAHTSRTPILRPLVEAAAAAGADQRKRIEAVEGVWNGMSLDRRRAVVACLVDVVLVPGGSGHKTFDPKYVQVTPKA